MNTALFVGHGQLRIAITDASCVGEGRRQAERLCRAHGYTGADVGRVQLVATELASNLHKHAGGGELLLQALHAGGSTAIELLTIDRGPGIADLAASLRDGYSTAGSAGTGLGAVSRLADDFDLYSRPASGTVVWARLRTRAPLNTPAPVAVEFGAVSFAKRGQAACGDGWALATDAERAGLLVADGLGHGPAAASATQRALDVFCQQPFAPPAESLQRQHAALRGTRGAAVACTLLDTRHARIEYSGLGNITGSCIDGLKAQGLASLNGTLGVSLHRVQQFGYAWPSQACVVLHSDGLSNRWSLHDHPGLLTHHPAVIAAHIYRDYRRDNDDATVVVAKRAR